MTETIMQKTRRSIIGLAVALAMLVAPTVMASSAGSLPSANASLSDVGSLQNGAKLYFNYCSGCHSLKLMRYSRIGADLGLSEEQVMKNFNFTGANYGEQIPASMQPADGKGWFGAAPPDLSLMARAKGVDYIYNYLKSFYLDPSRPLGWNNTVFPNASMPNVLWELQGIQTASFKAGGHGSDAVFEKFEMHQQGRLDAAEFDDVARDIANFLQYAAEPAALQRKTVGIWVLLFLGLFTLLAWLLKQEYWKDVH
jgi:ubiquinol-cytochrome c reductase cytochrome c1 subunit